ncbi:YcxB family protein [Pseudoalteromonas obscura]|uniref:YcxB family protein n=1 Tax=Pseudoalteromonas TaxID=53246 RepID=UPI003A96DA7F
MLVFQSEFTLDKQYFQECFDESVSFSQHHKPKYGLIGFLLVLGSLSHYLLEQAYLGNFLFVLAVIEGVSFYYRRPWWVARQMLSRASGSKVVLKIDEQGINAHNPYRAFQLQWQEIDNVIETKKGILLEHGKYRQYISRQALNNETYAFILQQTKK